MSPLKLLVLFATICSGLVGMDLVEKMNPAFHIGAAYFVGFILATVQWCLWDLISMQEDWRRSLENYKKYLSQIEAGKDEE